MLKERRLEMTEVRNEGLCLVSESVQPYEGILGIVIGEGNGAVVRVS